MKNIKYISEPKFDDIEKYKEYAKEYIEVLYQDGKSNIYLDDVNTPLEVKRYKDDLLKRKNVIFNKSLNKRIKYNIIMTGISAATFFTGLGLGNILVSLGVNPIIVYNLILFLVAGLDTYGFIHVNQDKFYYKKQEIIDLKKIKGELEKCNTIEGKINSLEKDELIRINFKREQIDNQMLRERHIRRNYEMYMDSKENVNDSLERINRRVVNNLESNPRSASKEKFDKRLTISSNAYQYSGNLKLTTKRLGRKVGKWLKDSFYDEDFRYQNRKEENYVVGGKKRR